MTKEFLPYEQALDLKDLGFDEPCLARYSPDGVFESYRHKVFENPYTYQNCYPSQTLAPLYRQAFRFFRNNCNMLANVYSNASGFLYEYHDTIGGTHRFDSGFEGTNAGGCWDSYEEAELACIKKLIEIVKQGL